MSIALRKRLPLKFRMHAAAVEWHEPPYDKDSGYVAWSLEGQSLNQGNYTLEFRDQQGHRIAFGDPSDRDTLGCRLFLQVGDAGARIPLPGRWTSGQRLGPAHLRTFLRHVESLNKWGQSIACHLIVEYAGQAIPSDGDLEVAAPVAPWIGDINLDALANDPKITYCFADADVKYPLYKPGDRETELYFGQLLKPLKGDPADRRFFTYKNALQVRPKWRGFACIGLVGNVYRVPGGDPYINGWKMNNAIKGGTPQSKNKKEVLDFIENTADDGWYMIWMKGHAGLIWKRTLYECKPSKRGFTKEPYTPGSDSAVRRFDLAKLKSPQGLKALEEGDYYYISKLSPPVSGGDLDT